jgi:hypothetical protein
MKLSTPTTKGRDYTCGDGFASSDAWANDLQLVCITYCTVTVKVAGFFTFAALAFTLTVPVCDGVV